MANANGRICLTYSLRSLDLQSRSPLVQLPSASAPKRKKVDGVYHAHLVLILAGSSSGAQQAKLMSSANAVRSL